MKLLKTKDGINTYFSSEYNQTYHSIHGVLQEAQHVFLKSSAVLQKIRSQSNIRILEIGFGTGFNFFLTAQKALENKASINFTSLENNLLTHSQFLKLKYIDLELAKPIQDKFLHWRKNIKNPSGENIFGFTNNIELNLILDNAESTKLQPEYFDAVYHDAFSPGENPELWTIEFFKKILCAMKKGAKLSTYSAKGSVRRAMLQAGFTVEKISGPQGKREMLLAIKD